MRISSDCFSDSELKSIIESKKQNGFCDVLKMQKQYIYDTDIDDELYDLFVDFIDVYRVATDDVPLDSRTYLKDELLDKWNIFRKISKENALKIVEEILFSKKHDGHEVNDSIFSQEIYIPQLLDDDYVKNNSVLYGGKWEDFCESIKHVNRFHTKQFNEKIFMIFASNLAMPFNPKTTFYRARINRTGKKFRKKEMGIPPIEFTKPGRIAAESIPCFYLASDIETSICEVRAGAHDVVNIAKFTNIETINVVDFRRLDKISPFETENFLMLYINKPIFESIKKEIEKPLRSSEKTVDYIPIHFLCDFIRYLNFEGVAYGSTMNESGFNISLFSDSKFVCQSVKTVKIHKIDYSYRETR